MDGGTQNTNNNLLINLYGPNAGFFFFFSTLSRVHSGNDKAIEYLNLELEPWPNVHNNYILYSVLKTQSDYVHELLEFACIPVIQLVKLIT